MKSFLVISLFMLVGNVCANDVVNTTTFNTINQNSLIDTTHIGTARDWELTEKEWSQYMELIKNPVARSYDHLTPPEILGIYAKTDEERSHFAEIAAKQEHDKLERELRFNTAFHAAAQKLYAAEPIIKPFDMTAFTPILKN